MAFEAIVSETEVGNEDDDELEMVFELMKQQAVASVRAGDTIHEAVTDAITEKVDIRLFLPVKGFEKTKAEVSAAFYSGLLIASTLTLAVTDELAQNRSGD